MEFVRVDPPGCDLAVFRRDATRQPREGSIAFLHGLGGASSSFAQALEAAPLAGYDVFLIDLLGHGSSDKPLDFDYRPASHAAVLFQALRHLDPSPPLVVVGYSLGGAIAVELAKFTPLGVRKLVLVEPAIDTSRMSFAERIVPMGEGEFRARYHEVLAPYGAQEATAADRHWAESAAFASSSAIFRSAKGLYAAAMRGEIARQFESLVVPTTLILSPQTRDEWAGAIPAEARGMQVLIVDSPSRAPFFDAPQAFYEAVAEAAVGGADPVY
jgi:pimeloyl-ACP methyl ester carboxylesterase